MKVITSVSPIFLNGVILVRTDLISSYGGGCLIQGLGNRKSNTWAPVTVRGRLVFDVQAVPLSSNKCHMAAGSNILPFGTFVRSSSIPWPKTQNGQGGFRDELHANKLQISLLPLQLIIQCRV
jgi:hypothetical protein